MKKLLLLLFFLSFMVSMYPQQLSDIRRAAEQGDVSAQSNLAACYYHGQGINQDYVQAVYWYNMAAEQGNVRSQRNLGYCYLNGQGVIRDYSQAVNWFRKAAEQGDVSSQNTLGSIYYYGHGIAKDYIQAVYWYGVAAEHGNTMAQFGLACCYYYGNGVTSNNNMALYWFERAKENRDGSLTVADINNIESNINNLKEHSVTEAVPNTTSSAIGQNAKNYSPKVEKVNNVKSTTSKISAINNMDGYIIKVEGDKIYLKTLSRNIKISDVVSVMSKNELIIDPVTRKEVRLEPEVVGHIKITAVQSEYSIGIVYGDAKTVLAEGMNIRKESTLPVNNYSEAIVMIAPAEVNFPQAMNTMVGDTYSGGGYIGDYVSAALMEQLLKSNKIQLIDRSILQIQRDELTMANIGEIDYNTMLKYGKIMGARYIVKITMQKPDVATIGNNIPVAGIMRTTQSIANSYSSNGNNSYGTSQPIQQAIPENVSTRNVKVLVNIAAHVVDLQTGRVLFMSKSTGKASGAPQLSFEITAVGRNTDINQGADFFQTITGKAVEDAFKHIGRELITYFNRNL